MDGILNRRKFILCISSLLAAGVVDAQKPQRLRRVAVSMGGSDDPQGVTAFAALREGLRQLGWVEGRNLEIKYHWGKGARTFGSGLGAGEGRSSGRMTRPGGSARSRSGCSTLPLACRYVFDSPGHVFAKKPACWYAEKKDGGLQQVSLSHYPARAALSAGHTRCIWQNIEIDWGVVL
jgi:hypothetical protein